MSHPKRRRRKRAPLPARIGDKVEEFIAKTGISRPTAYRMMAAGKLRYVQVSERIRRIPVTEYTRLGFGEAEGA